MTAEPDPASLPASGEASVPPRGSRSVFSRMAKNVGWIAGSRGFNAVLGVAYLAAAARALGPASFGAFALMLTYAQLIANFVQFQSWKGVIRYGALHVSAGRPDCLARLFGFTATLDFASAIAGALIAIVAIPLVGPLLHWAPQEQSTAATFAGILLLTTGATPAGMLRLFNRFDLAAYCEVVGPMTRLVGSVAAWIAGAGVHAFLVIWVVAAIAQAASQWTAAVLINRSRLSFGRRSFKQALQENERLWPFMLQTNVSNSVTMFWTQLGTLAVGAVVGPAEAGGFRLAKRLSKGIMRPVQPVIIAIYPELTRLVAEDDHAQLRRVVTRVAVGSAALALAVALIATVAGREILHLLAGKRFEFAYMFFVLLSVATAIDLAGFAFEPLQNAHGRSWNVLRAKLIGAVVYAGLLVVLLPRFGGNGAAIAAIICSSLIFVQLAYFTVKVLRRRQDTPAPDSVGLGPLPG
ncbi:MAG TPA: lipopolysaccharide biosynthesis protein [Sphingomicrobium sp.]